MDKIVLNLLRVAILNQEHERVMAYLDKIELYSNLAFCAQLCDKLQATELSSKVRQYISQKT